MSYVNIVDLYEYICSSCDFSFYLDMTFEHPFYRGYIGIYITWCDIKRERYFCNRGTISGSIRAVHFIGYPNQR